MIAPILAQWCLKLKTVSWRASKVIRITRWHGEASPSSWRIMSNVIINLTACYIPCAAPAPKAASSSSASAGLKQLCRRPNSSDVWRFSIQRTSGFITGLRTVERNGGNNQPGTRQKISVKHRLAKEPRFPQFVLRHYGTQNPGTRETVCPD